MSKELKSTQCTLSTHFYRLEQDAVETEDLLRDIPLTPLSAGEEDDYQPGMYHHLYQLNADCPRGLLDPPRTLETGLQIVRDRLYSSSPSSVLEHDDEPDPDSLDDAVDGLVLVPRHQRTHRRTGNKRGRPRKRV